MKQLINRLICLFKGYKIGTGVQTIISFPNGDIIKINTSLTAKLKKNIMNTEQQDKLWNDLSEESKKRINIEYKESMDGSELKRSIYYLFGSHNLNPKPLTYEDVARELFFGRYCYYTEFEGTVRGTEADYKDYQSAGHCTSPKQAIKLLMINKLLNVAKYLNGDWKPDWSYTEEKWAIGIDPDNNRVKIVRVFGNDRFNRHLVYFRTEELAQQAIQILGEETIKLALSTDY